MSIVDGSKLLMILLVDNNSHYIVHIIKLVTSQMQVL